MPHMQRKIQELTCLLECFDIDLSPEDISTPVFIEGKTVSMSITMYVFPKNKYLAIREQNAPAEKKSNQPWWDNILHQSIWQITFSPSLEMSHLSINGISFFFFNFRDLSNLSQQFESGNNNQKRQLSLKNDVTVFQLSYELTLHS